MSSIPQISVVMPVYNGEKYIQEAIESILCQTFTEFEFIIVDDGSPDKTVEIIESYKDDRIRLFKREHAGVVSALNFGIDQAQAGWIARQDADDVSLPKRFSLQIRALKKSNAVLCYGDYKVIGLQEIGKHPYLAKTNALISLQMCTLCPIVNSTVIFSKEAFFKAGGYFEEERFAEDFGMWGRLLIQGSAVGIQEPLVLLRKRTGSTSQLNETTLLLLTKKLCPIHCQKFCDLDVASAEKMSSGLKSKNSFVWIRWCYKFARTSKLFSIEMCLWCFSKMVRRVLRVY